MSAKYAGLRLVDKRIEKAVKRADQTARAKRRRATMTFRVKRFWKGRLDRRASWKFATDWLTEQQAMTFFSYSMTKNASAKVYNGNRVVASFEANLTLRKLKKG